MKRTGKLLVNLSKCVSSTRPTPTFPCRLIRPLYFSSTKRGTALEENKHSNRDSIILEKFRLRKLKGSAKTKTDPETKPPPTPSAEVVSSFQKLGLREELIRAVEEMGVFVPSEIQCVGIPAVLDSKSVVLSSASGSGRTLAYLLPLVQMLRRDEALLSMKPKHPRAVVLCSTEESADRVFRMAKSISHYARLNSSKESSGGESSKVKEDVSHAPIGMLVGTPSEILELIEEGDIVCHDMKYVVLDEADTLFNNGFGTTIRKIFSSLKDSALKSINGGIQTALVTSTIAEILGERLSSFMNHVERENAGKVTAMLLEMEQTEVFEIIDSSDGLKKKVAEAMNSLHLTASGS